MENIKVNRGEVKVIVEQGASGSSGKTQDTKCGAKRFLLTPFSLISGSVVGLFSLKFQVSLSFLFKTISWNPFNLFNMTLIPEKHKANICKKTFSSSVSFSLCHDTSIYISLIYHSGHNDDDNSAHTKYLKAINFTFYVQTNNQNYAKQKYSHI